MSIPNVNTDISYNHNKQLATTRPRSILEARNSRSNGSSSAFQSGFGSGTGMPSGTGPAQAPDFGSLQSLSHRVRLLEHQITTCIESQRLMYEVFNKCGSLEVRVKALEEVRAMMEEQMQNETTAANANARDEDDDLDAQTEEANDFGTSASASANSEQHPDDDGDDEEDQDLLEKEDEHADIEGGEGEDGEEDNNDELINELNCSQVQQGEQEEDDHEHEDRDDDDGSAGDTEEEAQQQQLPPASGQPNSSDGTKQTEVVDVDMDAHVNNIGNVIQCELCPATRTRGRIYSTDEALAKHYFSKHAVTLTMSTDELDDAGQPVVKRAKKKEANNDTKTNIEPLKNHAVAATATAPAAATSTVTANTDTDPGSRPPLQQEQNADDIALGVPKQHKKTCGVCGKKCPDQWKLNRHMKKHSSVYFNCEVCERSLKSEDSLDRHRLKMHGLYSRDLSTAATDGNGDGTLPNLGSSSSVAAPVPGVSSLALNTTNISMNSEKTATATEDDDGAGIGGGNGCTRTRPTKRMLNDQSPASSSRSASRSSPLRHQNQCDVCQNKFQHAHELKEHKERMHANGAKRGRGRPRKVVVVTLDTDGGSESEEEVSGKTERVNVKTVKDGIDGGGSGSECGNKRRRGRPKKKKVESSSDDDGDGDDDENSSGLGLESLDGVCHCHPSCGLSFPFPNALAVHQISCRHAQQQQQKPAD